jgi:septum formation protein
VADLLLCSGSETRAEILKSQGISFVQTSSDFDEEQITETDPKTFVYQATLGKYQACLKKSPNFKKILVADTVVSVENQILRKANSIEEAEKLLRMQSGNKVSILTATILKNETKEFIDISSTVYQFHKFDEVQLQKFLQSGEWRGKAGACMVETFCGQFIKSVSGFQSCAMGLSFEKIKRFLEIH